MNKNCIFTICAKNYVGLARILQKSIFRYNDNVDFFIVVADEYDGFFEGDKNVLIARDFLDIDEKTWVNMSFKYNLTEFCTCIKPFCVESFFENYGYSTVCYLDPDTYLFSDFSYIYKELETFLVVTTPHITIPDYPYTGDTPDRGFLFNGISNFGFVGFKKSAKTINLLRWWKDRLVKLCFGEMLWAVCTDQKWSDFFMAFLNYDEILFSDNLGLNVAPWNYYERKIEKKGDFYFVSSRKGACDRCDKLVFCHFAGYNYKELSNGIINNKCRMRISNLREYDDIKVLIREYSNEICNDSFLFSKYLNLPYSYQTFSNGVKIDSFHRRLYNGLCVNFGFSGDPFLVGPENCFFEMMKRNGLLSKKGKEVDQICPENMSRFERKLSMAYFFLRILFKIIGYKNYILLLQLMRRISLYDINTFLLGKKYENPNLKMKE